MCTNGSSRLLGQLEEIEARLLQHLAVLRVEEAEAVLVDHLDLDALPFLPALRADRLQDPLLDRRGKADAVARGRIGFTSTPHAGHRPLPKPPIITRALTDRRWSSRGPIRPVVR